MPFATKSSWKCWDSMEGWPYSAYNRLQNSAQAENFQQYSASAATAGSASASAQQILLHHQLRQAQAAQQAQQYLPPSLVAAASNNKHHGNQSQTTSLTPPQTPAAASSSASVSWKTSSGSNSNGLVIIPEPQKATNSRSYSNSELLVETASTSSGNSRWASVNMRKNTQYS